MNGAEHLSREQVLMLLEGELELPELVAAEEHLAVCSTCRALLDDTEKSLAIVCEAIHAVPTSDLSAKTVLQRRIDRHHQFVWFRAAAAAAALLVALGSGLYWVSAPAGQRAYLIDRPVPNPELTPGAVRIVSFGELCSESDDDLDPALPDGVQQAVFTEYHVPQQKRGKEFQVDYLINPQLGGTAEMKNLWPQPYATVWNAQAKDMLERRLHARVCRGELSLEQAQHQLAGDWIASYQSEFKTQTPLRVEAGLEDPRLP